MKVSSKGICRYCKHCIVFNDKEGLAICTKYFCWKDAPDTLETVTGPEDTRAMVCPGYEEEGRNQNGKQ